MSVLAMLTLRRSSLYRQLQVLNSTSDKSSGVDELVLVFMFWQEKYVEAQLKQEQ